MRIGLSSVMSSLPAITRTLLATDNTLREPSPARRSAEDSPLALVRPVRPDDVQVHGHW
jgi:hypothetical protein